MEYRVVTNISYGGISYETGQIVDIVEKTIAQDCIERGLIEEIKVDVSKMETITDEETENKKTKKSKKEKE